MAAMSKLIGTPDKDTFLVGHSFGCMAVIRYLERLPDGIRIRGAMIVGGRVDAPKEIPIEDTDDRAILMQWISKPVDWKKVLSHTSNFTGIFSDNDPMIDDPKAEAEKFRKTVGGKAIMKHGHEAISRRRLLRHCPMPLRSCSRHSPN